MEVLRHCFPNNLRRLLEELPKSLDETYKRILKEINNSNQKQAHRLLQCLAVAIRPLRVEELAELLALDVTAAGIPKFNVNWRWEDHEAAILSACSSLVSVIVDDGSRVVQFSHFSVKEYLTSDRLASCMEDIAQFHISNETSHLILAQACLGTFLCLDNNTNEDKLKQLPLYQYTCRHWSEHAKVGDVKLKIKDAMDCFLDIDKSHFAAFFRLEASPTDFRIFAASSDEVQTSMLPPAAPLYFAAIWGLSCAVERLITKQPEVIHFCGGEGTPLHLSVGRGHIKVAQLLLAHGADVNSCSGDNSTPLHIALEEEHLEIGKWLLKNGANINAQKNGGSTPLHDAASRGYLDVCHMLLEYKADVLMRDHSGNTPLHFAASSGHLEVTRMLLEFKAEVNSQNDEGSTPFLSASSSGNLEIVRVLLDNGADLHTHDNVGNSPLHLAASRGRLEVTQMLLELQAEVNSLNDKGFTPFLMASSSGNLDVVQLLLNNGVDVRRYDNHGNTSLHFSAPEGHLEVTRTLIELQADVNSLNQEGLTPLCLVVKFPWQDRTPDVVRILLINGADVHTRDSDSGNTLLHIAAFEGDLELTRMILERNVDVNSQNNDGLTAFLLALKRENLDVARLLLDHNADVHVRDKHGNTPLHVAAFTGNGHLDICHILLKRNAEVNSRNHHESTPLLLASERGPELVQLFLDHNADWHARDGDGDTLLHCAAIAGKLEVVRLLLELNAEVNSQNNEGSTPLHLASAGYEEGYPDVVRLLLDHGADMQICNLDGKTASQVARGNEQQEMVQLLSPHAAG